MMRGSRVRWEHLPGVYRYGTVIDIDGTYGVRTDDGDTVWLERRVLDEDKLGHEYVPYPDGEGCGASLLQVPGTYRRLPDRCGWPESVHWPEKA